MEGFFSLLRCFLCCQDEKDDTFYIDCGSNTRRTIRNPFNRGSQSHDTSVRIKSSSSPHYTYQVIHEPDLRTSVSSDHSRPSYAPNNNENRDDLERKLFLALLYNAQASSSSSPRTPTSSSSSVNRSSSASSSKPPQSSLINPSSDSVKPATSSIKAPQSLTKSPSSTGSNPSPQKLPPTLKPSLSRTSPRAATNQRGKADYVLLENDTLPLYIIPEDVKDLIKKGVVPEVLKKTLSPSRYKDYFAVLLYAEDYYYEKWSDYKLLNVTLELHEAAVYKKSDHRNKNINENEEKDDKIFVAFRMDAIPERRPFLLSRDLVYARPSGTQIEPFQGIIYRVVKSNLVLVEFNDNFHSQHHSTRRYDISFSFNRVSLKRAHQALNSISDSLLENFLFPNSLTRKTTNAPPTYTSPNLDREISTTIRRISTVQSSPPYLISGPRCTSESKSASHLRKPSRTGEIIRESVIQIYRTSPNCRILICSPSNSACDVLMRGLKKSIPETAMFRANAAFREREDVPDDILPSCLIREECFACPPIQKLRQFKVIFSTFVSCFRLHSEGLPVGHFSHVFMVDASFAIEPEAMVVLANFAGENTAVIAAGEAGCSPNWVRSEIGRRNGLKVSYFERLRKFRPYQGDSPEFITELDMNRDAVYL
ncbi:P-loop containing nucleoside triphosphate hydrolase [Parasponia andersonii]|uniref:P-loop containing nucleoside triphosphate hydrolase n=1 Tax=Parasponia andersonii TaxID=3476 RepID=A0A2P5D4I6_PARAD|nr:P-loop containing nucleoside triphosphate hydrolase [Parasponia andersonii]